MKLKQRMTLHTATMPAIYRFFPAPCLWLVLVCEGHLPDCHYKRQAIVCHDLSPLFFAQRGHKATTEGYSEDRPIIAEVDP